MFAVSLPFAINFWPVQVCESRMRSSGEASKSCCETLICSLRKDLPTNTGLKGLVANVGPHFEHRTPFAVNPSFSESLHFNKSKEER
jgi:hypothetical protein